MSELKTQVEKAAEKWVFETNGHKWSNNDNTAGDNFGSYAAGATQSPLLVKALEQLEQDRQVQGSCISTLKSLKHSGTLNPRAYEAVEEMIEVLFNHQRTTFEQLKEIRECMESLK